MAGPAVLGGRRRRRWPARVAGLLGTAALLASGAAIVVMVMPTADDEAPVPTAPAATPTPDAEEKPRKPKLTPAQRRARRAAVATLTGEGFEPVRLADYQAEHDLRVLIGRRTDGSGEQRAFFFAGRTFIGYDSDAVSGKVRVARTRDRAVTLAYGLYTPGDRRCCPSGETVRVRFAWDGTALTPQSEIPPAPERVPAA